MKTEARKHQTAASSHRTPNTKNRPVGRGNSSTPRRGYGRGGNRDNRGFRARSTNRWTDNRRSRDASTQRVENERSRPRGNQTSLNENSELRDPLLAFANAVTRELNASDNTINKPQQQW